MPPSTVAFREYAQAAVNQQPDGEKLVAHLENMRKVVMALGVALAVAALFAAESNETARVATELTDGAAFSFAEVPAELTARLQPGAAVHFSLKENITTGYAWAADYATNDCAVVIEHRGAEEAPPDVCGAPGKAVITVTRLASGKNPVVVDFAYRRCWEPNDPAKRVRLTLLPVAESFNDRKCATALK